MDRPWQLTLYEKSIKKRQTVETILSWVPELNKQKCLEIGCATGVTSYHLRQRGGEWVSVDFEQDHVRSTKNLVGDTVCLISEKGLTFESDVFDLVVAINFLEHIEDDDLFISEMVRVLKPGGTLILTAPMGEKGRLGYYIKRLYGFTADKGGFGHARDGYPPDVLENKFKQAGLEIEVFVTYSRLFTEIVEDTLNLLYHHQASKNGKQAEGDDFHGTTSPTSVEAFSRVGLSFKLYSLLFPLIKGITLLDHLIRYSSGYMLACKAKKLG